MVERRLIRVRIPAGTLSKLLATSIERVTIRMGIFSKLFNTEKLAAANATYKARMAEIREKEELDALGREAARLANDENLKAKLAENNAKLKAAWRG
jgi:cell shape-determining protein MreC